MQNLVIVGISDTADRIIRFVERYNLFHVLGCTVNKEYMPKTGMAIVGGQERKVYPLEELDQYIDKENDLLFVAVLWNRLNADRRKLYQKVKDMGYKLANIISPMACVRGEIKGDNCWICDGVVIQEHVIFGNNIFVKDNAVVAHWSVVEDHAFVAINATICGAVTIGEQSYIGANATVFDEVKIGKKCLVGGATVVKRNVPDFSVVKVPNDTMIIKQYPEDVIESKWQAHHNVR